MAMDSRKTPFFYLRIALGVCLGIMVFLYMSGFKISRSEVLGYGVAVTIALVLVALDACKKLSRLIWWQALLIVMSILFAGFGLPLVLYFVLR